MTSHQTSLYTIALSLSLSVLFHVAGTGGAATQTFASGLQGHGRVANVQYGSPPYNVTNSTTLNIVAGGEGSRARIEVANMTAADNGHLPYTNGLGSPCSFKANTGSYARHEVSDASSSSDNRITLYILGIYAMSGMYPAGIAYLLSSLLAVKHVNKDPGLLPGYKLKINAYNTNCEEARGLDAFFKEVYSTNRTIIVILGGTCSSVTESVAQVAKLWEMLMISYSSLSPLLSNKKIFPYFFRVMAPEQNLTVGRVKLFKELGWKRVHIIYENYNVFSTLNEIMKQDLKAEGIEVVSSEMFTNDPRQSVKNLRDKDARIIIAHMYEDKARQVVCQAYNLEEDQNKTKAWFKRVVWIFPSFFDRHWMDYNDTKNNCTAVQIREVIGRFFVVSSQSLSNDPNYRAYNGVDPNTFRRDFSGEKLYRAVKDEIPEEFHQFYQTYNSDGSLYNEHRAPEAYDAVWAIALALNNTLTYLIESGDAMRLENFTYRNHNFLKLILSGMCNVSFNSWSGCFYFNKEGERTPGIEIYQFNESALTLLGTCHLNSTDNEWPCVLDIKKIVWPDGHVPVDGIMVKARTMRIDRYLRYCIWTLASAGIILSAGLLFFNVINRAHRLVKMSSPRLNNIILVGCMMSYSTMYMLDLEGSDSHAICIARSFTVVLSFSLSFGALFAKTWRVYEIFTAGHKVLNTRMLRDSSLFLIVASLAVVNSAILICWVIVSPQKPTMGNISITPSDGESDIEYINQFQRCDSNLRVHFIWTLISIQGIVILFGTFLAIQTRKVSFPELNDSKWIALCIYNVVVLSPVGVVVVMATEDKPEINYALEASLIFLITTMTQCLIFVPKIIAFRNHNRTLSSVLNVELQVCGFKKIMSCLCLTSSFRQDLAHKTSNTSLEVSQQTQEVDINCDIGIKHHKHTKVPLVKSKSLSPEMVRHHHRKSAENPWAPCNSAQISYRTNGPVTPSRCPRQKIHKENIVRVTNHSLKFKVFETGCLQRSRSDSNVSVISSETVAHCFDDELPDFHEIQANFKRWRSLSKMPDASLDLKIDRAKVLADLKLSTRLDLKSSSLKYEKRITEKRIEQLLKQLKEIV